MPTSVRSMFDMTADKVKFRGKGFAFTATAGANTVGDFLVTENRLLDGTQILLKNHVFGDSVTFQVIDVDNILGLGANTVLDQFADSWYVCEDRQDQGRVRMPYSAELYAGLYIRVIYHSVGTTDVNVKINLFKHKYVA